MEILQAGLEFFMFVVLVCAGLDMANKDFWSDFLD